MAVLSALLVVLGLLVGCSRGDFSVSLSSTAVTIAQGKSDTVTVYVTRIGGFRGEITFAVTGTPAGVTARFNPMTTTGTQSALTLTVASTVAVGNYPLKITAASGKVEKEAALELSVVIPPSFSLSISPTSLSVKQGAISVVTVNLARIGGFADSVDLTLEGVPAGVKATFNPVSVTADMSTLTLEVASDAMPGTYTVTVRGKGGGLDKAARLTLTVQPAPNFSINLTPAAVTVKQGATIPIAVDVTRVGGFAEPVQLSIEGTPAGVAAVFDPNPVLAGTSTLTVAVDTALTTGTYTFRVRGTGGDISKTADLTLAVFTKESVAIAFPSQALEILPEWERIEQVRDWIVYAFLAAREVPPDRIAVALHNQPPLRNPALSEVHTWQYGIGRWVWIDDDPKDGSVGDLYAFLPKGEDQRLLGGLADEFRRMTGQIPTFVHHIEYTLDESAGTATFVLFQTLDGKQLFVEEGPFGYYERDIRTRTDLVEFLKRVDDLVYAELKGDVLRLAGRDLPDWNPMMSVEDIAALHQAYLRSEKIGFSLDPKGFTDAELSELRSFLLTVAAQFPLVGLSKEEWQAATEGVTNKDLRPLYSLLDKLQAKPTKASQDVYNIVFNKLCELADVYDEEIRALAAALPKQVRTNTVSEAEWREALNSASWESYLVPLYQVLKKLQTEGTKASQEFYNLISSLLAQYCSQCARYDGLIQGTVVAMTLFYCDLVAKLWDHDTQGWTPRAIGMRPSLEMPLASVYWEEAWKYAEGRLWFGPDWQDIGKSGASLFFDPLATRLYAAASVLGTSHEHEVKPTEDLSAFIRWWQSHWPLIMEYEPQFFRLNQIMKWSALMVWLQEKKKVGLLGFLNEVEVDYSHNFITWVESNKELTFKDWLPFLNDSRFSKTECLGLLHSRRYSALGSTGVFLEGGVTLAKHEDLAKAWKPEELGGKSINYRNGTVYTFTSPTTVIANPNVEARFRAPVGEVPQIQKNWQAWSKLTQDSLMYASTLIVPPSQLLEECVQATRTEQTITIQVTGSALVALRIASGLVGEMNLPWDDVKEIHFRPETGDLFLQTNEGWFQANVPEKLPDLFLRAGSSKQKAIIGIRWLSAKPEVSETDKVDLAAWRESEAGCLVFKVANTYAVPKGPGYTGFFLFSEDSALAKVLTGKAPWPETTNDPLWREIRTFVQYLFSKLPQQIRWESRGTKFILYTPRGIRPTINAPMEILGNMAGWLEMKEVEILPFQEIQFLKGEHV